jgi:DNA-binding FadR family transcriptional regulator
MPEETLYEPDGVLTQAPNRVKDMKHPHHESVARLAATRATAVAIAAIASLLACVCVRRTNQTKQPTDDVLLAYLY